jgi:hypothetical protein
MFPSEARLSWEKWAVSVAEGTQPPSLERRKYRRVVVTTVRLNFAETQ